MSLTAEKAGLRPNELPQRGTKKHKNSKPGWTKNAEENQMRTLGRKMGAGRWETNLGNALSFTPLSQRDYVIQPSKRRNELMPLLRSFRDQLVNLPQSVRRELPNLWVWIFEHLLQDRYEAPI